MTRSITNTELRRAKKVVRVKKKKPLPTGIKSDGRPRKKKKESPEILLRRQQALELRASGVTYKEIAEQLGYHDSSHAHKDVTAALDKVQIDAAKNVIAMDLALMDEFKMRLLHDLRTNGNLHQIDRIFRVIEWKYRLLGISDETVRQLQQDYGINPSVVNNTNNVQVVMAAPETETEFIAKMMGAVGIDPDSSVAQKYLEERSGDEARTPPMLMGSVNEAKEVASRSRAIDDDEIVDAEIVEE